MSLNSLFGSLFIFICVTISFIFVYFCTYICYVFSIKGDNMYSNCKLIYKRYLSLLSGTDLVKALEQAKCQRDSLEVFCEKKNLKILV